jgi:hypothetical protein
MNIPQLETILMFGTIIYPSVKIYLLYKKVKQGYTEKHLILKAICYTLFYEPFFIYDVFKYGMKKTNRHLLDRKI